MESRRRYYPMSTLFSNAGASFNAPIVAAPSAFSSHTLASEWPDASSHPLGSVYVQLEDPRLRARHRRRRSAPGWSPTCRRTSPGRRSGRSSGRSTPTGAPTSGRSGWSSSRRWTAPATRSPSTRTRSTSGRGCSSAPGASAVLALGLTSPSTPRLAQLGFLIVAGFLLVNKVYSPQYVLWLLPLAVLARPRWRDLLIWQAGEVIYFAVGVVVPRRLPRPRRRRGRRLLLGRDADPHRRRAVPRRGGGARHLVPAARPGAVSARPTSTTTRSNAVAV